MKSSEIINFDLETSVRTIVQDFLEPMTERATENYNDVKDLKMRSDFLTKKFEELDRNIKIDLNLRGTLADLKKRVHSMDVDASQNYTFLRAQVEQLQNIQSAQNEKFNALTKEKNIFVTVKDSLQHEIRGFEKLLDNFKGQLQDDILNVQSGFNQKLQDLGRNIGMVESEFSSVKTLVKRQMEEFTQVYYQLEINKLKAEQIDTKIDKLPIFKELEDTDNYINRFLPFKIQNMIDETLFNCLGSVEMKKLLKFEDRIFKSLSANIESINNKLNKDSYEVPQPEHRKSYLRKRDSSKLSMLSKDMRSSQDLSIRQNTQTQVEKEHSLFKSRKDLSRPSHEQSDNQKSYAMLGQQDSEQNPLTEPTLKSMTFNQPKLPRMTVESNQQAQQQFNFQNNQQLNQIQEQSFNKEDEEFRLDRSQLMSMTSKRDPSSNSGSPQRIYPSQNKNPARNQQQKPVIHQPKQSGIIVMQKFDKPVEGEEVPPEQMEILNNISKYGRQPSTKTKYKEDMVMSPKSLSQEAKQQITNNFRASKQIQNNQNFSNAIPTDSKDRQSIIYQKQKEDDQLIKTQESYFKRTETQGPPVLSQKNQSTKLEIPLVNQRNTSYPQQNQQQQQQQQQQTNVKDGQILSKYKTMRSQNEIVQQQQQYQKDNKELTRVNEEPSLSEQGEDKYLKDNNDDSEFFSDQENPLLSQKLSQPDKPQLNTRQGKRDKNDDSSDSRSIYESNLTSKVKSSSNNRSSLPQNQLQMQTESISKKNISENRSKQIGSSKPQQNKSINLQEIKTDKNRLQNLNDTPESSQLSKLQVESPIIKQIKSSKQEQRDNSNKTQVIADNKNTTQISFKTQVRQQESDIDEHPEHLNESSDNDSQQDIPEKQSSSKQQQRQQDIPQQVKQQQQQRQFQQKSPRKSDQKPLQSKHNSTSNPRISEKRQQPVLSQNLSAKKKSSIELKNQQQVNQQPKPSSSKQKQQKQQEQDTFSPVDQEQEQNDQDNNNNNDNNNISITLNVPEENLLSPKSYQQNSIDSQNEPMTQQSRKSNRNHEQLMEQMEKMSQKRSENRSNYIQSQPDERLALNLSPVRQDPVVRRESTRGDDMMNMDYKTFAERQIINDSLAALTQRITELQNSQSQTVNQTDTLNTVDIFKNIQEQIQNLHEKVISLQQSMVIFKNDTMNEQDNYIALVQNKFRHEKADSHDKLEELKAEFKEEVKRRKREKGEIMSEFGIVLKKFEKGKEGIDKSLKQNALVQKMIQAIIKCLKIQQSLDLQDDMDKESIFLMGCKEVDPEKKQMIQDPSINLAQKLPLIQSYNAASQKRLNKMNFSSQQASPKQQVVSLDKNCLTCSQGGIPMALSAFKIACITYMPSLVNYENAYLPRRQLIEIKGHLIDICEENQITFDPISLENGMREVIIQIAQLQSKPNSKTLILPQTRRQGQLAANHHYNQQSEASGGYDHNNSSMIGYSRSKELKQKIKNEIDLNHMNSVYDQRTRQYSRRAAGVSQQYRNENNSSIDPLNRSVDDPNLKVDGNHCLLNSNEDDIRQMIKSQAVSPTNNNKLFGNQKSGNNNGNISDFQPEKISVKSQRQSMGSKELNRIKVYQRQSNKDSSQVLIQDQS